MKMERKPLINEDNNKKCPHCNKDLPTEIDFCPYCMERLKTPETIVLPTKNNRGNKKILISLVALVIISISLYLAYFISQKPKDSAISKTSNNREVTSSKKNQNSDNTDTLKSFTDPTTSDVGIKTDTYKTSSTNNNNVIPSIEKNHNSDKTSSTQQSSSINENSIKFSSTEKTTSRININATEIISRWNTANNNLYIYNYPLNNYTLNESDSFTTISQHFNNSGAKIDFRIAKNSEEYTLKIDNISNLNIMYQLARISLCTVAGTDYSDTEFYDFISDDSWKNISETEFIKSGIYSGYTCKVILTEITEQSGGGLEHSYYTCLLTMNKSNKE